MRKLLISIVALTSATIMASPLEFSCSSNDVVSNEMLEGSMTRVIVDVRANTTATVQKRAVVPNATWVTAYKLKAIDTWRYTSDLEDADITFIRGNKTGILIKNYFNSLDKGLDQEAHICTQY